MTTALQSKRSIFHPRTVIVGLFVATLFVFLALVPVSRMDGQLIGSDGISYYVYVRSLVIDHDLNFANEYSHFKLNSVLNEATATGRAPNKFAIGPALLWMPFFLAAHVVAHTGNAVGMSIQPDGYGYLYQAAISIGSIVYGMLGFVMAYACAKRLFSRWAAVLAVALLWLAGNAFYYMAFEPSMSHMVSQFSVSALLTVWFMRFRETFSPKKRDAVLLGLVTGLVMLVRLQDVIFALIPFGWMTARAALSARRRDRTDATKWVECAVLAGMSALLVFSIQMATWQYLYGTWLTSPYMSDHSPAFYWLSPQVGPVLFSTFHGLFTWHPIYLAAVCGLPFVIQKDRWTGIACILVLCINIYIIAAWWAWWQGDAFGGRMFLNAMWIWVLGLTGFIEWLLTQRVKHVLVGISIAFIVWNALSLMQYRLSFVPMDQPLTIEQMTIGRLHVPVMLIERMLP
jgi:hypothetical protein